MYKRRILNLVVLLFVVLFAFGCARIQLVTQDGIQLPPETLQITNPETGLSVEAVFVRYYEDSPESIYPKYLDYEKVNYLSDAETQKTTNVILFLRVWNKNKIDYKVVKYIRYSVEAKDFTKTLIYSGNDEIKHYQLALPIVENQLVQIQADIADEDMVLFKLGYFNVKFGSLGKEGGI
jgi:hypothetical protein